MKQKLLFLLLCGISGAVFAATQMAADRISDIRNTKHNFASNDIVALPGGASRDVKAANVNQVCVFCHTPHGKPGLASGERQFLWNRSLDGAGYTRYDSSSLNLDKSEALGKGSKMCLSCHDGTVAIGQLDVINGRLNQEFSDISMIGDNVNAGLLTGSRSNLGQDLSNDHPIGFTYSSQLVTDDGELVDPNSAEGAHIGVPVGRGLAQNNLIVEQSGGTPAANQPTDVTGAGISVPLESIVTGLGNRDSQGNLARVFVDAPGTGSVECTTCHDPHIRSTDNAVNIKFLRLRRFQKNAGPVAANGFNINNDINCLACHKKTGWEDSAHASSTAATQVYDDTVADDREFPRDTQMWEASCLNCHDPHTVNGARWLLTTNENTTVGSEASDVDRACYKCHTGNSPAVTSGATVIDSEALLGGHAGFTFVAGDTAHQPGSDNTVSFLAESSESLQVRHVGCSDCHNPHAMTTGLHVNNGSADNNNVSGALSRVSGLAASDSSGVFDPYGSEDTATPEIATKEYQVCFKCHSTYGHRADNISQAAFSNTVMEFSNTTSAHPVISGTGNTSLNSGLMVAPFNSASGIGNQTMYCSDCHTNTDLNGTPVDPKGSHNNDVAACETCHATAQYNFTAGTIVDSGFACQDATDCAAPAAAGNSNNLHVFHASKTGTNTNVCSNCHVKVPHGWKNKALLANINDPDSADTRYYGTVSDPAGAKSKIDTMSPSGQWKKSSCGTAGGCH
ncbi:MAG TPA: hypothetical protein ENK06_06865 [Gammaproteobacteria bacterium]|nr:hypothetical protein [Gammaproteobacteria bacterium]